MSSLAFLHESWPDLLSSLTRDDAQNFEVFLRGPPVAFVQQPDPAQGYTPAPMKLDGAINPAWRPFRRGGLSDRSVRSAITALKSLTTYLIDVDYLTNSPFKLARATATDTGEARKQAVRKKVLREQAKAAVDSALVAMPADTAARRVRAVRRRYVFDLFYYLGIRMSEAVNGTMTNFAIRQDRAWFDTVGKGNKVRSVPVPEPLLQSLRAYRLALACVTEFPLPNEKRPLIASVNGMSPIKETQVRRMLQAVFRDGADHLLGKINACPDNSAEIADITAEQVLRHATPHWLRHTYTTNLFKAGVDPRHIQANLGHASIDTTLLYDELEDAARHDDTQKGVEI